MSETLIPDRTRHPSRQRQLVRAALALTLAAALQPAWAWGKDGHRLIAELAETQLSPAARAEANRLLALEPGSTLGSVASWADEVRNPTTQRWHFVNMASEDCRYVPEVDCPGGECVVGAIERQVRVLKSKASDDDRLKALKYVVHLVGDVHQPLHAGFAEDKGGNQFQLQAFGKGTNLHSLWDSGLIKNREGGPEQLSMDLKPQLASVRPTGTSADWAMASCKVVRSPGFYPSTHKLTRQYPQDVDGLLQQRLATAAVALAQVLNGALTHE
jgi:hypothetical protein